MLFLAVVRKHTTVKIVCILSFLLLLPSVGLTADSTKDRASGIVKPKVSTLSTILASENPVIEEYILPEKYSVPHGLAIDSKDMIWVTETANNSLAVFDPATKQLKEYRIPSTKDLPTSSWEYDPKKKDTPEGIINVYSSGSPGNVIVDQNDVIWFVLHLGNSVARFDPVKEEFTEYIIPVNNAQPYDLAADSKGIIWFIERNSGNLSYIDVTNNKTSEIKMGQGSNMMGMAIDSKDNIWVGDVARNYIARYNPSTKKLKRFPFNVPNVQPGQMRFDKDGKLWFCSLSKRQLGVLMPDPGVFSVVDMPGYNAIPQGLAIGKDSKIWVVDGFLSRVGYFDQVTLAWNLVDTPLSNSAPMNIEMDSKGDIWFTQSDRKANRIARLVSSTMPDMSSSAHSEEAVSAKGGGPEQSKAINIYTIVGLLIAVIVIILVAIRIGKK